MLKGSKSERVAVQCAFCIKSAYDIAATAQEVLISQHLLDFPNILSLVFTYLDPHDVYFIWEFYGICCDFCSLSETNLYEVIRGNILEDIHKRWIAYQLLRGLAHMH